MLAIESFGRRWRRSKVFWGSGGKSVGHLKGYLKNNQATVVDFRDQIGIYVLFNEAGQAVYVGQAGVGNKTLFARLKDHRGGYLSDRWTHFSWFGLRGKNAKSNKLSKKHRPDGGIWGRKRRDALFEIEGVLMAVVEPPLNKKGPNWTGTKEFRQYIDERVPLDIGELVGTVAKRLVKLERRMERKLDKLLEGSKKK